MSPAQQGTLGTMRVHAHSSTHLQFNHDGGENEFPARKRVDELAGGREEDLGEEKTSGESDNEAVNKYCR